ncbi:MAG: hypothetical protein KGH63_04310 [Candidatus Micrarchaeota archaeon]|nr:hypothetical protein [Candidatus Micrarchaeota archaeon]
MRTKVIPYAIAGTMAALSLFGASRLDAQTFRRGKPGQAVERSTDSVKLQPLDTMLAKAKPLSEGPRGDSASRMLENAAVSTHMPGEAIPSFGHSAPDARALASAADSSKQKRDTAQAAPDYIDYAPLRISTDLHAAVQLNDCGMMQCLSMPFNGISVGSGLPITVLQTHDSTAVIAQQVRFDGIFVYVQQGSSMFLRIPAGQIKSITTGEYKLSFSNRSNGHLALELFELLGRDSVGKRDLQMLAVPDNEIVTCACQTPKVEGPMAEQMRLRLLPPVKEEKVVTPEGTIHFTVVPLWVRPRKAL